MKTEAVIIRVDKENWNYIELFVTKQDGQKICVKDELVRLKHAICNPSFFGLFSHATAVFSFDMVVVSWQIVKLHFKSDFPFSCFCADVHGF